MGRSATLQRYFIQGYGQITLKRNMKFYWPLSAIKRTGPFQKSRRRVGNKKSAGRLATLPSVPAPIQEVVSDPETPLTPTDKPPITPLVLVPAPDQEPLKTVQPPLATSTHSLLIPDPVIPPPTPLAPKQAVRRKHKGWVYVDDSDPRDTPNEEVLPNKRQRKAARLFDM